MVLTPMRQTATWNERTTGGLYGSDYTDHTINCRYQADTRRVRNKNGEEVTCTGVLTCEEAIKADDLITIGSDTWPVVVVQPKVGPGGDIQEYQVRF